MLTIVEIKSQLYQYFEEDIYSVDSIYSKWYDLLTAGNTMSLVTVYKSMMTQWPGLGNGYKWEEVGKGHHEHLRYLWTKSIRNFLLRQENPGLLTWEEVEATGEYIDLTGSYGLKEHHLYVKAGNVWYPKLNHYKGT